MIDRASVRMYKVGFGDCFLLRFWSGRRVVGRVLIDCGSITEGKARVDRVVADIVEACTEGGKARIDLVVGTHRHKDHVGGFANPAWAGVEVGEVWLPWTEDPDDPDATRIRERQSSLAAALVAAAGLDTDDEPLAAAAPKRESDAAAQVRAHRAMALNALTNEKAMATLHGGFANRPEPVFLPLKDTVCEARSVAGVEGLTVHVLGPPRDTRAMAAMDPPDGAGYLAAAAANRTRSDGNSTLFSRRWVKSEAAWRKDAVGTTFRRDCQAAVDAIADQPMGAVAAALDNAVNNTSLILMFEVAGQWLLFPADAQWGAWNAALKQPVARALLEKTTFYKVGHHGSHNATPRTLIEEVVAKGFTAMLSTGRVKQWPEVPRGPLVDAIVGRAARCARSDDDAWTQAKGFKVQDLYMEWDFPPPGTSPPGGGAPAVIRRGSTQEQRPMTIVACTPKHLPHDKLVSTAVHALRKPPSGPPGVVAARAPLAVRRAFLSVLKEKRWQTKGVRLTVGFLDGAPADLRARIVEHMNAWNKTADVLFTETDGQADVRISRVPEDGYWSYIGTDILLIDKDQPTMNLEGFTMNTRDSEFRRVVRHETGHTLGFPHEHMRRELVAKIDRDAALRYYGDSQGWTEEEIEAQVLTPIEESSLLGTDRSDKDSIMCYQVPGGLTVDGKTIPGGSDIDDLDYEFAGQCYPKPAAAAHDHDHDHEAG